jgi:flagellar L-ring protein precursor FlgH
MIRPEDVSPSNEISSTYVANAKITYSGIGILADKQKPGWLGRVIDYVWPF